jgi:hypothetical protein
MSALYDFTCSDHRPLTFQLNCFPYIFNSCAADVHTDSVTRSTHDWSRVDDFIANMYSDELSVRLSQISIPSCLRSCCYTKCSDKRHAKIIDDYYHDVIDCVKCSMQKAIPVKSAHGNSQFNVPGWNDYVQDKYDLSRVAFLDWVYSGRPRSGETFIRMSRARATFKLALRYCRQHEDQMRADACAKSLDLCDTKGFWNKVRKASNGKATKYASSVAGVSGDDAIASMWRVHFNSLYNSVDLDNDNSKDRFFYRINSESDIKSYYSKITVQEISDAVSKQKKGKATGPDGIAMEAFMFAHPRLFIHLSVLFNMFMMHCHIPAMFMQSVIVPLVKSKGGDLTDVNNYRAIALSNTISKILECIFMSKVTSNNDSDVYQFGFKAGHSTGMCMNTMKKVVDYYIDNGSHVFACFVDFSKAFDRVNYWKLFNKLLDDDVDCNIVALLAVWYSGQEVCIQWKNTLSSSFHIGNGTRQGGILSPYLFTRYIRELICAVVHSNIGCNIGGVFYNVLAYADDIVLLAPSWYALRSLINLLNSCARDIDMTCNVDKTVCMVFNPKCKRMIVVTDFPCFTINGSVLQYVNNFKYLGHIINNSLNDNDDVKREVRNLFMRSNILTRRFSRCSTKVKLTLFKAYCMCLYDAGIWKHYSVTAFNKLRSCYYKCTKMFFGYDRRYSVTSMLSELNLPSFDILISNCVGSFETKWSSSVNDLLVNLCSLRL